MKYYLRFCGTPLCVHKGSPAGRRTCEEADVDQCGYRTLKEARAAMHRLNSLPGWAGAASVHRGWCPSLAEDTFPASPEEVA
jgi:hypothetical protein